MDRKSIIVLVISFALLLLWPALTNKIFPPKAVPRATNVVTRATNQLEAAANAGPSRTNLPVEVPVRSTPLVTAATPEQL
jgi:hypothetical protein